MHVAEFNWFTAGCITGYSYWQKALNCWGESSMYWDHRRESCRCGMMALETYQPLPTVAYPSRPSRLHQSVQGACHLWKLSLPTLVWTEWLDEKRGMRGSITAQGRYEGSWFMGFLSVASVWCPQYQAAACCPLLRPRDTRGWYVKMQQQFNTIKYLYLIDIIRVLLNAISCTAIYIFQKIKSLQTYGIAGMRFKTYETVTYTSASLGYPSHRLLLAGASCGSPHDVRQSVFNPHAMLPLFTVQHNRMMSSRCVTPSVLQSRSPKPAMSWI